MQNEKNMHTRIPWNDRHKDFYSSRDPSSQQQTPRHRGRDATCDSQYAKLPEEAPEGLPAGTIALHVLREAVRGKTEVGVNSKN